MHKRALDLIQPLQLHLQALADVVRLPELHVGRQHEVDLDEQRNLMSKLEQEFNDNYSAGASPASDADFGF